MMMGTKLQQFSSTMTTATSSDQYCSTTTTTTTNNNNNNNKKNLDEFPNGLRVLVVDDDTTCLRILEQMLRKCSYHVTTCCQATVALNLLRERKGCFDLVISDVHMPDMDGFKLLEHVGLETDLPVIMMSADGRTSVVMRGVKRGVCDYLIKPVRLEELKNVWQHVVRKRWSGSRDPEQSASMEETDRHKRAGDDVEYASSANEGTDGSWKIQKKRKDAKEEEDEGELENDDLSTSKKPRVVWSVELHQQFVTAVNQLGIDKAVPKRILELMNVPGLSRENVASHLQKFRLYLKRLSGVAQQQSGIYNNYYGTGESIGRHGSVSGIDIQALAASGQIPPETLAALHAEVFGRPTGTLVLPVMDKAVLIHAASQGGKSIPVECGVAFGQPIAKCPPHISKQFPQSSVSDEDIPSGISTWRPNNLTTVGSTGNHEGLSAQNNNLLMQMLQQQQHHHSVLPELSHTINVRPSCLVVPSQSPTSFQTGNISAPFNQSSTLTTSSLNDYSFLSAQSHNVSVGLGQVPCVDTKGDGVLDGYSIPSSISSSVSSCSGRADNVTRWQAQNFAINSSAARQVPGPNMYSVQGSYASKKINLPDQELGRDLGFVGRGYSVPSRFAVEDLESSIGHVTHAKTYGDNDGGGVKQELNLDFFENAKIGMPVIRQYSPSDLMSVLSK